MHLFSKWPYPANDIAKLGRITMDQKKKNGAGVQINKQVPQHLCKSLCMPCVHRV